VPVVSLSFSIPDWEQVSLFLVEHWHRACLDPFGYAFWGVIWSFAFAATFLLLRMFFTGWGDKNVTEKTLALSILLHVLLAMVSTTVMLRQDEPPPQEVRTRIRRVVVDGVAELQSGGKGELAGRPRWDAPESATSESRGRIPRATSSDIPLPVRERDEFQAPDLPLANPVSEPEVMADRSEPGSEGTVRAVRPNLDPMVDREVTATRRREAGQAGRSTRSSIPSPQESGGPGRGERSKPADSIIVPSVAGSVDDIEPGPKPTNPLQTADNAPLPKSVPGIETAEMPETEVRPDPKGGGPGSKFSRTGRSGRSEAAPERELPTRGMRPDRTQVGVPLGGGPSSGVAVPGDDADLVTPQLGGDADSRGTAAPNRGKLPDIYRLRQVDQRGDAARRAGATQASEQAVAASLAWLAEQQLASGAWPMVESVLGEDPEPMRFTEKNDPEEEARQRLERSQSGLQAESGVTALAILAYLGAGHTSEDPQYGRTVSRGLKWLVAQQVRTRPQDADSQRRYDGFLGGKANRFARMYCHGMATIALGEAYGMTRDPVLKEPLEKALRYIVRMQYPDGSWRYSDWQNQRNATGDMSLFGWQVMALKSAQTAGIELPNKGIEKALDRARQFLVSRRNEMRGRDGSRTGGLASYRPGERPRPAMTAESLFCWQLLGAAPNDPAMVEAVESLRRNPPRLATQDIYYWYYGTLAMFQHGGIEGEEWTRAMQDTLVSSQRQQGDESGSWDPRRPWGDYGGRIFSTAMSTLCLEVYYRYLPMYQQAPQATAGPTVPGKVVE